MKFEKTNLNPRQVTEYALGLMKSYKEVKTKTRVQLKDHLRWKPPPIGVLKLNTDGAILAIGKRQELE